MPHQSTSRSLYRPRDKKKGPTRKVTFSVSEATIQGLNKIRAAFRRRWPEAQYPSLSATLEKLISKDLRRLSKPEVMAAEIRDFERRYPRKTTKPAVAGDSSATSQSNEVKS